MKTRPSRSLSVRLSLWLAIQTFVGLGFVSLVVYLFTVIDLRERQAEALVHKKDLVLHLLEEAQQDRNLATLKHKLDDFFLGHREMSLTLRRSDGSALYEDALSTARAAGVRSIDFEYPDWQQSGGTLSARMTLDTASDGLFLRRLGATLLGAALVGALAVSAGSFVLVRIGLGPLRFLVDQTRSLTADKLCQRLDGSGQPSELQPLIAQFNDLLERLSRTYDQLEGFNADVAHELRTPLATMIASTELAMRRMPGEEEMSELLGSNLEELRRMSGIVNDMLFLSYVNSGAVARRERVESLAAVAHSVAEYHEAAMAEADIQLRVEGDGCGEFDLALLKRALSNLLGNATRYATPGSTVLIQIKGDGQGNMHMAVVNEGTSIEETHLPRLFDRFYRADASRSQASSNHGLGLSIVAAIAHMHHGQPFAMSALGQTRIGFSFRSAARKASSRSTDIP